MMDPLRAIADAVLYEGYLLWPYRRSALKNQRRWTFGGVYPRAHAERHPDDPWRMRTEVVLDGSDEVDVTVRFLHVVVREDGWEEAVERELKPGPVAIRAGSEGGRAWEALEGSIDVACEGGRVIVEIANTTPFAGTRELALRRTFCSTHTILRSPGTFVAAHDDAAAACCNEHTWPVRVGDEHTVLSSPIILEDFPQVAPESPGDLFDGGEIDQMLVLNILALTDEEKAEMRETDPRSRAILERTEALTPEQLMRLHGAWR
jgi:hypothetical protein